ncbi:hypothetical protein ABND49_08325 [Paenibacillus larvae]|uniref:Uncharacterized protein n=1 Tax=Paenibacillus larvae TaxID=1464 RepID=A0AAP5N358_9BACL|nr:hypothetical protein [Paenibacillus larvae]MDT2252179.1 hypothetical protein [Paenibacillus larvae]MDV3484530.1 hypothetical protein [Paenibacillus larvae]
MLFFDPAKTGKGYGKQIIQLLVSDFGVTTVDVNKQNENAKMFYYCHLKLTVNQRSFMGRDRLLHEAFLITGG